MTTPTQLLQVPFGTDQIFSLLFDYSKAALLEDPKRANTHSETPDDLDLREAKNLRVALESTLGFGGAPTWRITERDGRWNVLTIELNAPDQSLGTHRGIYAPFEDVKAKYVFTEVQNE